MIVEGKLMELLKNNLEQELFYRIKTPLFEMKDWRNEIEVIEISENVKENLINYIDNRYRHFEFDKAPKYKFYLLSVTFLLNHIHQLITQGDGYII